jgi:hypothetical protein
MTRLALVGLLVMAGLGVASPSVFPENAGFAAVGYARGIVLTAGAEVLLPIDVLDTSVGITLYTNATDAFGFRLAGSALVIPAFGTTPPLALGVGADVGYDSGRGFNLHLGPLVGTDLLFSLDLPMTLSAYLGVGYAGNTGLSLAWAAQLRYYVDNDNVAIELASSDLALVSLGVRVLF